MSQESYVLEVVSDYGNTDYYTLLQHEIDTLSDNSIEHYWEVFTYRRLADGELGELINNTGIIDNYAEAITNYGWHLDLYYGKTIEEVMY